MTLYVKYFHWESLLQVLTQRPWRLGSLSEGSAIWYFRIQSSNPFSTWKPSVNSNYSFLMHITDIRLLLHNARSTTQLHQADENVCQTNHSKLCRTWQLADSINISLFIMLHRFHEDKVIDYVLVWFKNTQDMWTYGQFVFSLCHFKS